MSFITKLTNREQKIIELLMDNTNFVPVKLISENLKISTKTVYRDMKKIEEKANIKIFDKKQGNGIKIICENLNNLKNLSIDIKPYSIQERRIKIFLWLLQHSKEYTSIYYLSNKYFVGRTSIISDLSYIETHLLGKHLTIEKNKNGTRIIGDEEDIRSKIKYVFENYSFINKDCEDKNYTSKRIDKNSLDLLKTNYPIEDIIILENIIKKYEKNLPYTISDVYYTNMIVHILIAIERIKLKKYVEYENVLNNVNELFFKEAKNIAKEVENSFDIKFPKSEIIYIYKYLTSTGVGKINTNICEKWIDNQVEFMAKKFISSMFKDKIIDFNKNEQIYMAFQLHIRALMQRLEYNIQIKNPLTEDIKNNYPIVFKYLKETSKKVLNIEISDDEIAYLTVYVQYLSEKPNIFKKVIIVCHSGFGTSVLLKKRILANFEQIEVIDILASDELDTYDLSNIDLIISTVNIYIENFKNIVYVSTLLLKEDIENINTMLIGEN